MINRLALLLACVFAASAPALEIRPGPDGIAIEAGSLGSFTLTYPQLIDDAQKPTHKLIEKKSSGNAATLKYDGGAEVGITVAGGTVKLTFANVPAGGKYLMDLLIDTSFGRGGTWRIGDRSGAFPREKPAGPHLFQGNAGSFRFANAQGQALAVKIPDYAYQELNDNREWNWNIYAWKFIAPFLPDHPSVEIAIAAETATSRKLVDPFGQIAAEEFPGKLRGAEELKADVAADEAYYAALPPPAWDRFGGLAGSGAQLGLQRTGFFHVEAKGDRTWLVDPDGNAFFHLGNCCFAPGDDYTYIKGREDIYEWLPDGGEAFATAFRTADRADLSFHLVNQIRKYGRPYDPDAYAARMIGRVRAWGFNSIGAFSRISEPAVRAAQFPYVAHLPLSEWEGLPRVPGVFESFDPFDEATLAMLGENIAKGVAPRARDPLLIGWFVVNEPRFDEIPKGVPALDGKHACKRRLVAMLREKYGHIEACNAAWAAQAKSFDELNDAGLAVKTDAARRDLREYAGLFLDAYFGAVSAAFRRHDPNHLLLGARYQPVTINDEQLCRITGKHCDIMSFNYYTHEIDPALLRNVHTWSGRPVMLSEFFWSSPKDSGLAGGREVGSQRERGLTYRQYVEQAAALGFVVGIEWFTLVDQAATGRWFSKYNGESANTGLIAVSDRPWQEAVAEMRTTNLEIYDVLLARRPPFARDHPRAAGP